MELDELSHYVLQYQIYIFTSIFFKFIQFIFLGFFLGSKNIYVEINVSVHQG